MWKFKKENQDLSGPVFKKLKLPTNRLQKLRACWEWQPAAPPCPHQQAQQKGTGGSVTAYVCSQSQGDYGGNSQVAQGTRWELRPRFYQEGSNPYMNQLVFQIRTSWSSNLPCHTWTILLAHGVRGKQDPWGCKTGSNLLTSITDNSSRI